MHTTARTAAFPLRTLAAFDPARSRLLSGAALVVGGSLLIAAGARVQVPLWPVPVTLQTLAVLLVGATLGARLGALAAALYLLEGAAGLPVFAGGGGAAHLVGPTGGYLFGFVLAAGLVGWCSDAGLCRRPVERAAVLTAGTAVIFACGLLWLTRSAPANGALAAGLAPHLPGAAVKIALACALLPLDLRVRGRR